jgi:Dyp-type peroxidase family
VIRVHPDPPVDRSDVQGNILRGYRKAMVRHLVLTVQDPAAVRRWLLDATSHDSTRAPQITSDEPWDGRPSAPATCVNVGFTAAGLVAVGVPPASLATFPHEFVDGMSSRAVKLGDTDESDPVRWNREWRDPDLVHLVVSIHADDDAGRSEVAERVVGASDGRAFCLQAALDGETFPDGLVHFGYRDGIAQPRFEHLDQHEPYLGTSTDGIPRPPAQPLVEIGGVLLGYRTPIENVRWEVPEPPVLGFNGSFNAFRVLEQQVDAFETFLTTAADTILSTQFADAVLPLGIEETWVEPRTRHDAMRELVAAKIMGRWRNGAPLTLFPDGPPAEGSFEGDRLNGFGYADDPDGLRCPIGSHIRRANPRDGRIVARNTNHSHRIVRRGIPYGPRYDPDAPVEAERGLLGSFICASLIAQFEALQYDWINLGLQDPRITGTNDAVVGNNDPRFSSFRLAVGSSAIVLREVPNLVITKGGAYLFLPSIRALEHLGSLP